MTAVSGQEPELELSAINALPVIQKGVGNAKMSSSIVVPDLIPQGGTIFIIGKQLPDTNAPFLTFGTSQSVSIRRGGVTADLIRVTVNSTGGTTINNRSGIIDGVFHTIRLQIDNVNQKVSINDDSDTSIPCILGAHAGGTFLDIFGTGSTFGDKAIAEIVIYTRSLTMMEIADIEDYLRTKYAHY